MANVLFANQEMAMENPPFVHIDRLLADSMRTQPEFGVLPLIGVQEEPHDDAFIAPRLSSHGMELPLL